MGHKFLSEVVASLLATGVITGATTIYWHVTAAPEPSVAAIPVSAAPAPVVVASTPEPAKAVEPPVPPSRPRAPAVRVAIHTPPATIPAKTERIAPSAIEAASMAPDIGEPVFDTGIPGPALVDQPVRARTVGDRLGDEPALGHAVGTLPVMAAITATLPEPARAATPPAGPAQPKPDAEQQDSGGITGMVMGTARGGLGMVQGAGSALMHLIP